MKEWPEIGNCLIVQTATNKQHKYISYDSWNKPHFHIKRNNYHLVFDNIIGYNKCCKICEVLAGLNILNRDYTQIRRFRGDMTLRVTKIQMIGKDKPPPKPLITIWNMHSRKHDRKIKEYLEFRENAIKAFNSSYPL